MVIALPPATVPPAAVVPTHAVTQAQPAPHGWTTYTVKDGDTLLGIAARFRTTSQVLASRNEIRDARRLWVGKKIEVPVARATAVKAAPRPARAVVTHTVRAGETLSGIAKRYGTTVPALAKASGISPRSFIRPGQQLRLTAVAKSTKPERSAGPAKSAKAGKSAKPTPRAATPTTSGGTAYLVKRGDTLLAISKSQRVTVASLVKANGLRGTVIHPGQRLVVPKAAPRKSTPANTFAGRTYPDHIVKNAARNRAILAERSVPTRAQTKAMIIATAQRHGVDPKLALAISLQESGWNQRQVSVANAVGIMQVIPSGGEWASSLIGRQLDLLKPQDNVTAGVVMLRALTRAADNADQAIAGYYQGLASVRKNGMFTDTKSYVANVNALKGRM